MQIKTIEERLKVKADYLGAKRAKLEHIKPDKFRDVLKAGRDSYSVGSSKAAITQLDGWDLAEVYNNGLTKLRQAEALEELRTELIDMQDRLSELVE